MEIPKEARELGIEIMQVINKYQLRNIDVIAAIMFVAYSQAKEIGEEHVDNYIEDFCTLFKEMRQLELRLRAEDGEKK